MINVAHQYFFLTPEFNYTGNKHIQFRLLNGYSKFTAWNSTKILALSFRKLENTHFGKIAIVPPLLRKEVLQAKPQTGDYIHGYLLNSGYSTELTEWSNRNPEQELHFFWNKKNVKESESLTPMLTLHTLNDTLFLKYMAGSKAYATTSGFESVCEAMYLQKPVLMVPTHIEQECNVIDALRAGEGISAGEFDLNQLLEFIPIYNKSLEFNYWIHTAESLFMLELTRIEPQHSTVLVTL